MRRAGARGVEARGVPARLVLVDRASSSSIGTG